MSGETRNSPCLSSLVVRKVEKPSTQDHAAAVLRQPSAEDDAWLLIVDVPTPDGRRRDLPWRCRSNVPPRGNVALGSPGRSRTRQRSAFGCVGLHGGSVADGRIQRDELLVSDRVRTQYVHSAPSSACPVCYQPGLRKTPRDGRRRRPPARVSISRGSARGCHAYWGSEGSSASTNARRSLLRTNRVRSIVTDGRTPEARSS